MKKNFLVDGDEIFIVCLLIKELTKIYSWLKTIIISYRKKSYILKDHKK